MTNEQILAACRSNWEYRGVGEAAVREMLDELSAHLEDAEAAGRTGEDVVGPDVRTFAAAWARERAPFARRALRTAAMACFMVGCLLLFSFLLRWTVRLTVTADHLAFWAAIGAATVAWELRRGGIRLHQGWLLSFVVGLPVALLVRWLVGKGELFTLPLWAVPVVLLPSLPYVVSDARARRNAKADAPRPR
ncbi:MULTISPECIES: hypothetical protein [Streptomyces]|uniref:DUF1707 domain-containing protein n=1 Tax=Streptomyces spororaveus TaxID=284039 RepID=A0ABQ3TC99_9ACTN|nr:MULTISPECIES: hypothetical protein [Streptomyces]MCM9081599.1 hypothetical protein [Streptomyces spororaveus]MCX5303971.1 hypothetical protein [Streptomyces sp. NBC_00160]GHI77989.1 hypothetical protein Sspor_35500 [Streptomyces spororaveus]